MTHVRLSDKSCALCGAKEDTMYVKNTQEEFQAVLCQKHVLAMLKKWDERPKAVSPIQGESRD